MSVGKKEKLSELTKHTWDYFWHNKLTSINKCQEGLYSGTLLHKNHSIILLFLVHQARICYLFIFLVWYIKVSKVLYCVLKNPFTGFWILQIGSTDLFISSRDVTSIMLAAYRFLAVVKVSPPWSRGNETREGQQGVKHDLSQPALLDHSRLPSASSSHNACYSNHGCDIRSPSASLSQLSARIQVMTK